MPKRLASGDVIEFTGVGGFVYVAFVGRHREYGDTVLVAPREFVNRPPDLAAAFHDAYVAFYPASISLKNGTGTVAGRAAAVKMPARLRRMGVVSGGRVKTWIIEDDSGERVTSDLTPEELSLPLAEIWNHVFLVDRVHEGWRPEHEGGSDSATLSGATEATDAAGGGPFIVSHYLYFPALETARKAARRLAEGGFAVETKPSAFEPTFLVLARHHAVELGSFSDDVRREIDAVAAEYFGEYDGWEAEPIEDAGDAHN